MRTRRRRPDPPFRCSDRFNHAEPHTTVYYTGTATLIEPVHGRPWAWTEHHLECDHKHPDLGKAQDCGRHLGERKAREANARWRATLGSVPCTRLLGEEPRVYGDGPGFIWYCRPHSTCATKFWRDPEEAAADTWSCPWGDA